jgi:hypothetical protein
MSMRVPEKVTTRDVMRFTLNGMTKGDPSPSSCAKFYAVRKWIYFTFFIRKLLLSSTIALMSSKIYITQFS